MKSTLLLVVLGLLAALAGGCSGEFSRQEVDGLTVSLATEPNPPRVGETVMRARLVDRDGSPVTEATVQFSAFLVFERVPTEPEHYVKAAAGELDGDAYRAAMAFTKPGKWKVSLKISRPQKPFTLATFTLDVGE